VSRLPARFGTERPARRFCRERHEEEPKMKNLAILAAVAAGGFALAGCDSKAENQVEEQATAIDEAYEADADLEESLTDDTPDEAQGEAAADAMREKGENIKDHLEDEADEMDSTPQ
jgi:hypothetical protein